MRREKVRSCSGRALRAVLAISSAVRPSWLPQRGNRWKAEGKRQRNRLSRIDTGPLLSQYDKPAQQPAPTRCRNQAHVCCERCVGTPLHEQLRHLQMARPRRRVKRRPPVLRLFIDVRLECEE